MKLRRWTYTSMIGCVLFVVLAAGTIGIRTVFVSRLVDRAMNPTGSTHPSHVLEEARTWLCEGALIARLFGLTENPDPEVKRQAAAALYLFSHKSRFEKHVKRLETMLRDSDPWVRWSAFLILEGWSDHSEVSGLDNSLVHQVVIDTFLSDEPNANNWMPVGYYRLSDDDVVNMTAELTRRLSAHDTSNQHAAAEKLLVIYDVLERRLAPSTAREIIRELERVDFPDLSVHLSRIKAKNQRRSQK